MLSVALVFSFVNATRTVVREAAMANLGKKGVNMPQKNPIRIRPVIRRFLLGCICSRQLYKITILHRRTCPESSEPFTVLLFGESCQ